MLNMYLTPVENIYNIYFIKKPNLSNDKLGF